MTVDELLNRVLDAYTGATPEALKTFKPVFHARLKRHEGTALDDAATAVLATFAPTTRKPFPIPADFETHLPAGETAAPDAGPSIRAELEARIHRSGEQLRDWHYSQGAKIRGSRPWPVYAHCVLQAIERSKLPVWRYLSAEEIDICEKRALSQARVRMFGRMPATNEAWDEQIAQVRGAWAAQDAEAAA